MQAACAEIMRLAASFMVDEGLALCATVHDAVLIEASIEQIDADVEVAKRCWARASDIVLGGFALDADSKIVRLPRRVSRRGRRGDVEPDPGSAGGP